MSRRLSRPRGAPSTERAAPASESLDLEPLPTVVRRVLREEARAARVAHRQWKSVSRLAALAHRCLLAGGRLIYVGAGTSGRLGAMDAAECPPTFGTSPRHVLAVVAGGPKALARAIEGAEDDLAAAQRSLRELPLSTRDLVCGISASARTPFVLAALAFARGAGAKTALISCNPQARVRVDVGVALDVGPEVVAGSTRMKAATATRGVLTAVSTSAMVALGHVYRGRMIDVAPTNQKLKERAERMVAELAGLSLDEARRLLAAGGTPSGALAMYYTGLPRAAAQKERARRGLRALAGAGMRRRRGAE